jgi:outer membrane protein assembly factor BamB
VGERLFVVSEPADVICINASDGKVIWQVSLSMSDVIGKEEAAKINESYQELTRQEKVLRKSFKQLEETDPNREKIKQQSAAIKLKINAMKASYPIGRGSSTNACGTPLCDGERLFVTMGTGIVAALTLDGKIIWNRFVEGSRLGFGHSNSGVLADGKLIVQYKDLIALDPATGKELWRSQSVNPRYATPVVTEIGDQTVVVHPSGSVIRASDGTVVGNAKVNSSESTSVIDGGILFGHSKGSVRALRIPKQITVPLEFEELWNVSSARDRRTPSSVYHDGLLYSVTTSGLMDVVKTKTGKMAYKKRLEIGRVYSSLSLAGDMVFASSTNGETLVFKAGPEFEEIARNKLESCGSCLLFVDKRLYLRGQKHLYCISE